MYTNSIFVIMMDTFQSVFPLHLIFLTAYLEKKIRINNNLHELVTQVANLRFKFKHYNS